LYIILRCPTQRPVFRGFLYVLFRSSDQSSGCAPAKLTATFPLSLLLGYLFVVSFTSKHNKREVSTNRNSHFVILLQDILLYSRFGRRENERKRKAAIWHMIYTNLYQSRTGLGCNSKYLVLFVLFLFRRRG
jgi:hypothetical protein